MTCLRTLNAIGFSLSAEGKQGESKKNKTYKM